MPSPGGEISPSDIFGVLGIAAIVKDLVGDSFAVGNDSSFSGIKTDPALLLSKYRIQDVKGMQRCPRCGAEISKEFAFCNFCGAAIPVNERNEAPADGVQCPKCGAVVEKGMRFCTACGQEIPSPDDQMAPVDTAEQKSEEKKCPQCGAVIRDDSSFCSECGTKLS